MTLLSYDYSSDTAEQDIILPEIKLSLFSLHIQGKKNKIEACYMYLEPWIPQHPCYFELKVVSISWKCSLIYYWLTWTPPSWKNSGITLTHMFNITGVCCVHSVNTNLLPATRACQGKCSVLGAIWLSLNICPMVQQDFHSRCMACRGCQNQWGTAC